MARHRRFLGAVLVTSALAATALGFAATGNAAVVGGAPYVTAPSISVSTTGPCRSTPLTVAGADFVPGSTVTLTLAGFTVGSVTVGANGGFTTTITVPEVPGTFQLVAAGPATATNPSRAEATLNILSCVQFVPVTG